MSERAVMPFRTVGENALPHVANALAASIGIAAILEHLTSFVGLVAVLLAAGASYWQMRLNKARARALEAETASPKPPNPLPQ